MFTFFTKREIRHFHVVVVQCDGKIMYKNRDAVLVDVAVVVALMRLLRKNVSILISQNARKIGVGTKALACKISSYIRSIRAWMQADKLNLNENKTEAMLIGIRQQLSKVNLDTLAGGDTSVPIVNKARNLGVWFDSQAEF